VTVQAATREELVRRPRVAVGADTLALAGLGVLVVAIAAAAWGTWGDLDSDTGFDVIAGARLADGELPYRDFTYYYGPLGAGLLALLSGAGATGLSAAVGLGLVLTVAIIAATYALARTLVDPLGAFLAAAITAAVAFTPNNYSYVLPHAFAAPLGTLLLLCFLLAIVRFAVTRRPAWLLCAGASAGLVTLTKPEPALAVLAAGAAWLVLRRRAGGLGGRELLALLVPALAIPVAVYGAFLAAVSPHQLLLENLYPADELAAGGDTLLRARMPLTAEAFARLLGKLAFYAGGAALLMLLARAIARGDRRARLLTVATALAAALAVAVVVARPDGLRDGFYYAWGWVPAGALVAVAVAAGRYRRRGGPWTAPDQLQLAAAIALAVVAATCLAFTFHGWRPQMAVYYAPLAALLVARLHLVELARSQAAYRLGAAWVAFLAAAGIFLALDEAGREQATVRGPGGALAEAPTEAALYRQALVEVEARTRPGDPIFVTPLMTGLYVLSERENPLREISSMPSALPTAADERAAIARLDDAGVRLVITDTRPWPGYGHGAFGETFQRRIAGWLEQGFERVRTIRAPGAERALVVWARDGSSTRQN
jgi:hypothetical protein